MIMKALVYQKYGSIDVLELKEVPKPEPKSDEVLVKILAASVNNWDWDRLTGRPYLYRLLSGITKPKLNILGADISGIVESVGNNVKSVKAGEHVYGDLSAGNWGGFAEYVCAPEKTLTHKPASMSFEQAAAIPQAGVMALQGLVEKRQIQAGQKFLMNGGGGGVGTFAIQMAKHFGAEVTCVDHTNKLDFMRSLGADHVIDYTKVNFTKTGDQYDVILDVVANQSIFDYKRALTDRGIYHMIGGKIPSALQVGLLGPLVSSKYGKQLGILGIKPNKDLNFLNKLFEEGKVKPVIDKIYPLKRTAEALQRIGDGTVMGKVVIKI